MAYVDLNPVRAKMANTPEKSDFTSIKQRTEKAKKVTQPNHKHLQPKILYSFAGNPRKNMPKGISMRLTDYRTGRVLRGDKRGAIPASADKILTRLGIDESKWLSVK